MPLEAHHIFEAQNNANLAKLRQLLTDAKGKAQESTLAFNPNDAMYWDGFASGVARAIHVLEGKG